ncbi:MAG TPA: PKD domain-containing protein, partial [Saprospiraceae bacterium]|nr:PKD domain-containing protein [Saprospiraceae bacterium]
PQLSAQFKAYEVWRIDVVQFDAYVKKESGTQGRAALLQLGKHQWRLELVPSGIIGPEYKLQVLSAKGLQTSQPTEVKAYRGTELNGYGHVRLTVDEDFISGFVMEGQKRWYIEPLWYHDFSADRDLFVVYDRDQVIFDGMGTCGAEELEENRHLLNQKHEKTQPGTESSAQVRLEYALASDRSMFNKYGSVTGVENHNIAVVNDVEGDYTGNFNNDLCIDIVTQFVVTGTDPWTNSTDAGTLLASFRNWGNAGNFGVPFDDAGLWTNRDFDGGTIGIAYLNGICNSNKYHCLQDFSTNSEFLRVLNSHEMGHNFSCTHDAAGSNTIMAPSVSAATAWSSQSVSQFNAFSQPLINNGCLGSCSAPPPLVADFIWNPDPGCVNQPIQFTDQSTGQITGRSWVFPGGTPGTSTQTNPVVTWSTPGVKNVSLTLSGAGGPVTTTKQVTINPLPAANFTASVSGLTVTFNNTSTNATVHYWEFGDGNTSNEEDPVHTYAESGNYMVVLTVSNECGTATKTLLVITAPTADFSATPTEGCTALTVQFQNQSSTNAVSYQWQFPGGVPSTSNQQNPTVTYYGQGNFNVTLTAINSSGTHTFTRTAYIKTLLPPSPSF